MSKNTILLLIFIVILAGGAVWSFNSHKNSSQIGDGISETDKLSLNDSLECAYTDEQKRSSKAYVKNGLVRADITSPIPGKSSSFIIKDDKMYIWTTQGGLIIEMTDATGTQGGSPSGLSQKVKIMAEFEKYKQYCKRAVVLDSEFVVPSDITFKEYSQISQQGTEANQQQIMQDNNLYGNPQ